MKKTIICGAGIGGLVTAIRLAEKGIPVEIYEKNFYSGGKMGEFRKNGFRFDTGPSVITIPEIIEDLFKDTGRDMEDYLEFTKPEISCKYFWEDGTMFNSYNDKSTHLNELKKVFSETEMNNFSRFLEYGKNFYELYNDIFGKDEFNVRDYLSKKYLANFTKFVSGRSINDVSNKFFRNVKIKQIINRFATFTGSSPYLIPQFYTIIPYAEFEFGSYSVKGGMYRIASALEKICNEYGIEINYGCELIQIVSEGKEIIKLIFRDKENNNSEISGFEYVVSNFTNLKELTGKNYFENTDWSSSGFIIYMGMDREFKELAGNNVLFSEDYENEYIDVFEKKIPADDMTIYISISSKLNKEDAPQGNENWFVFVNAPHLSDKFDWNEKSKMEYFEKVINKMDKFIYLFEDSIRNHILFYEIFSPLEFKNIYNCESGTIYGLSSNSIYTLIKRIKNKSSIYSNLFFTGGNTNPGGGVPLCFLSAKSVSGMIK